MKTFLAIFLLSTQILFAQGEKKKRFPTASAGIQYAGSIGWLSAGYYRQSKNKKIELGLLYGYTPEFAGGKIHSLTLKFIYEPFRINIKPRFEITPLQTGVFVTQNFAKNLSMSWDEKYDPGYYWWTNSMRFHLFFGSEAAYVLNSSTLEKIAFYFETNTNDLYLASYLGNKNYRSLGLNDIFFFGFGTKIYFK